MTRSSCRSQSLRALGALAVFTVATACGASSAPDPGMSGTPALAAEEVVATADPAAADAPTGSGEAAGLDPDIDGSAAWQDVSVLLTADEQSCILDAVGELLGSVMSLSASGSRGSEWEQSMISCLEAETARKLFLSDIVGFLESDVEVEIGGDEEACLRELLDDIDLTDALVDEDADLSATVWLGLTMCVRELTASVILVAIAAALDGDGFALDDGQRSCLRDLAADPDLAALTTGESETHASLPQLVSGLLACTPNLWRSGDDPDDPGAPPADAPPDDHPDTADGATPLDVGEAASGSVDYEYDVDFFVFEAEAGGFYRIDVSLGTLSDSVAGLYDAEESELASNDDYLNLESRIDWQAENSGTYYVAVAGYSELTGSYTLTVNRVVDVVDDDPEIVDDHSDMAEGATAVEVGEAASGSVDYEFDVDFFVFEAEAGGFYRIDVSLGTLSDSVAVLYDAKESELAANDDYLDLESRINWQAESSGAFYVSVAGYEAELGSYTLTVEHIVDGEFDADGLFDTAGDAIPASVSEAMLAPMDC